MKVKEWKILFYRGIYGGVHWKPFLYNAPTYKEIGWLLWVLTFDKDED